MQWFTLSSHDDGLGEASLELLASAQAAQRGEVEAELQTLLALAARLADAMGVEWTQDLQRVVDGDGWLNVHLSLSGPAAWTDALAEQLDQ